MRNLSVKRLLVYVFALIFVIIAIFPFLWSIVTSLKPDEIMFSRELTLFPERVTFNHYVDLFSKTSFLTYFKNSVIVTAATVLITICISSVGAYGLTRFEFRGRETIAFLILFSYMFPGVVLVVPLYLIMVNLQLADTLYSLILANTAFSLPLALLMLRSFLRSIPVEIEEAAMVDGASKFYTFIFIILPLAMPGIVATAVFTFYICWSEYLFAVVFISTDALMTVSVGLATFLEAHGVLYGMLVSGSVVATIPVIILFIFVQKHLIRGFGVGTIE